MQPMPNVKESLSLETILAPYQKRVERDIENHLALLGPKNPLRDACEYALTTGGKRFRPALVYIVAEGLGKGFDVTKVALAVEYFHSASLIADDLPCMDNDSERRNKPTVHKVFGETTALLASYALIAAAFELIAKNGEMLDQTKLHTTPAEICRLGVLLTSQKTGILGTTGGQYIDIFPPQLDLETLQQVTRKKTVTLFDISMTLGWLFGGGDIKLLDKVSLAADHFGTAFQIVDDLEDMAQDKINERSVNFGTCLGIEKAALLAKEHLQQFNQVLKEIGLANTLLSIFAAGLSKKLAAFIQTKN